MWAILGRGTGLGDDRLTVIGKHIFVMSLMIYQVAFVDGFKLDWVIAKASTVGNDHVPLTDFGKDKITSNARMIFFESPAMELQHKQ